MGKKSVMLDIDEYCENCPYFSADTTMLRDDYDGIVAVVVTCDNRGQCSRIYKYLKKQMERPEPYREG